MRKKLILLAVIYYLSALFINASPLGDYVYFQVVARIIYIPVAFWILTFAYGYFFQRMQRKRPNVAMTLLLGLFLHLFLLLAKTYFLVVLTSDAIAGVYKIYIETIFYVFVIAAAVWWASAIKRNPFFMPVTFAIFYPMYLAAKFNNTRIITVIAITISIAFLMTTHKKAASILSILLEKIKAVFASRRRVILAIFIFAFLVRLAFGINIIQKTKGEFPAASDDGTTYDMHAYNIATDISYLRTARFTPTAWDAGYSLFLALVYKVFGRSFYAVIFLQSVMGAFVPLLVYFLGEAIVDKRVGLLGGLWCSLDQPLIMMSSVLGQEAVYIPILTFIIFLLTKYSIQAKNTISYLYSVLIGILLGLANIVRSAIFYFAPFVFGYIFSLRNDKSLLKKAADAFLVIAFISLIIAPVTYLNFLNSGKFRLLTETKPITQWDSDEGSDYFAPSNKPLAEMGVNPLKDIKGSLSNIAKKPLKFLAIEADIIPKRIIGFFFCYNFGFFDPIYMVNAARIPNPFASNLEFYISLFILTGFILILKNRRYRLRAMPSILLISYYVLLHVVMFRMGNIRYRSPIHPFLFIFGALAILSFVDYLKKSIADYNENITGKP